MLLVAIVSFAVVGCCLAVYLSLPYPGRHEPELPSSIATSSSMVLDDLQAQYVRGDIEVDVFEARVWSLMTAPSPEETAFAEAEGIAAGRLRVDEAFRVMHEAKLERYMSR